MAYTIEYLSGARRELKKLPQQIQRWIIEAIEALADGPRPRGAKKLVNANSRWRIRPLSDYRVIYEIHDKTLVVLVLRVAHRSIAYRDQA